MGIPTKGSPLFSNIRPSRGRPVAGLPLLGNDLPLQFADRLGRVKILRAGGEAVGDLMASP